MARASAGKARPDPYRHTGHDGDDVAREAAKSNNMLRLPT
jgi:hypothetical protein